MRMREKNRQSGPQRPPVGVSVARIGRALVARGCLPPRCRHTSADPPQTTSRWHSASIWFLLAVSSTPSRPSLFAWTGLTKWRIVGEDWKLFFLIPSEIGNKVFGETSSWISLRPSCWLQPSRFYIRSLSVIRCLIFEFRSCNYTARLMSMQRISRWTMYTRCMLPSVALLWL